MDFGVIASENAVTGRHPSIGGDNAVIRSSDGHTCSDQKHTQRSIQEESIAIANAQLDEETQRIDLKGDTMRYPPLLS